MCVPYLPSPIVSNRNINEKKYCVCLLYMYYVLSGCLFGGISICLLAKYRATGCTQVRARFNRVYFPWFVGVEVNGKEHFSTFGGR